MAGESEENAQNFEKEYLLVEAWTGREAERAMINYEHHPSIAT